MGQFGAWGEAPGEWALLCADLLVVAKSGRVLPAKLALHSATSLWQFFYYLTGESLFP